MPSEPRKAVKNNVQCDEHVGLLHRGIWQRVATVEVPESVSQLVVEARRRRGLRDQQQHQDSEAIGCIPPAGQSRERGFFIAIQARIQGRLKRKCE